MEKLTRKENETILKDLSQAAQTSERLGNHESYEWLHEVINEKLDKWEEE